MVSVIPNAVVAENFRPLSYTDESSKKHAPGRQPRLGPNDTITIVVISRLFYNKGTDLLIAAIPRSVCFPSLLNAPICRAMSPPLDESKLTWS